jgi:uncharacterized protein (DUF779 family)
MAFNDDSIPAEQFKFIELAPEVFHSVRKMNNIDEKFVKQVFSFDNLQNLIVDVSEGRGGSFFIKPKQGGIILKQITKAEYGHF